MAAYGGSNPGMDEIQATEPAPEGERAPVSFRHRLRRLAAPLVALITRKHASEDLHAVMSGAATVMAIRLTGAMLVYASTIFLARWLGGFEFGIYAYVWVLAILLANMLTLGYPSAVLRFVPEYQARAKWGRLRGFLRESYTIIAVVSIAGCAVCALLVAAFADWMAPYYVAPFAIGLICVPFTAMFMHTELTARGFGWMQLAYTPPYILRPLLTMVFVFALFVLGFRLDAIVALWALLASSLVSFGVQAYLLWRRTVRVLKPAPPIHHSYYWASISGSFIVIDCLRLALENADVILVGQLLGPTAVGAYYAAARTGGLIAFIYFAVIAMAVPRFSKLHASQSRAEMQRFVSGVIHLMFWPSALTAAGLALLGPSILSLFGMDFVEAYSALLVVLAGFLVRAATGPAEYILAMTGHQRDAMGVYAVSVVVCIVLNYILIPQLGVLGAALSVYGVLAGASVWLSILVRKRLGIVALLGF